MKKSILWYVAICAGAIACASLAILAVMYIQGFITHATTGFQKFNSFKDRAIAPFKSRFHIEDEVNDDDDDD